MIALALLLQAAAPAAPAPVTRVQGTAPERFSVLAGPCAPQRREGEDVVVCGESTATAQRLPYPDEYVPNHGVPSNPNEDGVGALAAADGEPCAMRGCQVGVGPPLLPMIAAAVTGIRNAKAHAREQRARRADGDRRVAIDLAAQAPAGTLEP